MQDNIFMLPRSLSPAESGRIVPNNLPAQLTPLVGREAEVADVCTLLRRHEVRLLTLTGTGGVGKTRLGLQVATELREDFADGVYFVSLAPLSQPDLVLPMLAQTFGLKETPGWLPLEHLKAYLHEKQVLVLLDNFEQVIAAAPLLVALLQVCPALKLLVTSRARLRVSGEFEFLVPPLALPDLHHLPEHTALLEYAAVALFLQRAEAILPGFQLTSANERVIAEICVRLDGLPLAIELAAARARLFPPQALLARLDQRLAVLTGGARDMPVRQQTLRNTLAWSYELLDAGEQRLFRLLSVFVGGCTLQAIEALCAALNKSNGAGQVLERVASLLDKSLLQQREQEGEEPRFLMLETIREYGLEALGTSGEMEVNRQAHADYFLALAEDAEPELVGPQQAVWLERLERELENLRAALLWGLVPGEDGHRREMALRLGGALRQFWIVRGHWSEGRNFLERALGESKGVAASVQVKALITAANLAHMQAYNDRAEALAEESRALCRELRDTRGIALSLRLLGAAAARRGSLAAARQLSEEALALFREVGDKESTAMSLFNLAWLDIDQGEYAKGRALLEESLALHRELGNKRGIARSLQLLARALFDSQDDQATVRALLKESLVLFKEVGDKEGIETFFFLSGQLALSQGDIATARELAEKSLVINTEVGNGVHTAGSLSLLARVEARRGDDMAARALYDQSFAVVEEGNYKWDIALSLEGLAGVVATRMEKQAHTFNGLLSLEGLAGVVAIQGEPAWAARLYGAVEAFRDTLSVPIPPVYRAEYERSVAAIRAQLGEQAFAAAWAEGRTNGSTRRGRQRVTAHPRQDTPHPSCWPDPTGDGGAAIARHGTDERADREAARDQPAHRQHSCAFDLQQAGGHLQSRGDPLRHRAPPGLRREDVRSRAST